MPFVGEMRSWQIVFFALGLPGLALALVFVTIKEPIRRGVRRIPTERGERVSVVSVTEVAAYLSRNWKTLVCHNVGFALLSLSSYGTTSWIPAFFQRTHGWEAADVGVMYGAIVALFGTSGIVFGGWLADRIGRTGTTASKMYVGLLAALIWVSTGIAFLLVPTGDGRDAATCADGFLRRHAVWCRSRCDSRDDAQYNARPSVGRLSVYR